MGFLVQSDHDNFLRVRSVLYDCGVRLAGPPIRSLVTPVPVESLRDEIFRLARKWGDDVLSEPEAINNHFYQSFTVLHYCRSLYDLHTGRINSKRAGAEWVKANMDPSWNGLIDRSWSGRPSPEITSRTPADPEERRRTFEFAKYMMEQITQIRNAQQSVAQRRGEKR